MLRNLPRRRSNSTRLLSRRPGSLYQHHHRSSGDVVAAAGIHPAGIAWEEGLVDSIDLGEHRRQVEAAGDNHLVAGIGEDYHLVAGTVENHHRSIGGWTL